MLIGTLAAIRRYPVKSLRGEALESVEVSDAGIPGDRESAFFVEAGHARVGKTYRGKEHERLHLTGDPGVAQSLAADRGVRLERRNGGGFFDDAPISLLVDRWLDELSAHTGYRVEWERFRPNFFVRAAPEFALEEAALSGAELSLGTVRLRMRYPIERCVATTYDPAGGPADPGILRYVAQHRNAWMGLYCDVLEAGRTATGEEVRASLP